MHMYSIVASQSQSADKETYTSHSRQQEHFFLFDKFIRADRRRKREMIAWECNFILIYKSNFDLGCVRFQINFGFFELLSSVKREKQEGGLAP